MLEAAIFELSEKRIGRGFLGMQEIVKDSFGSVDALLQRGQRITGLATHYTDLDEMTSGLQKADLVIIAARPSMGKTAFAMNIAENAAIDGSGKWSGFSRSKCRVRRCCFAFSVRALASTLTRCAPARSGATTCESCARHGRAGAAPGSSSMTRRAFL